MSQPDPLWQRCELAYQQQLQVLGRRLQLRASADWALEIAERSFSRFTEISGGPTLTLRIVTSPGSGSAGGERALDRGLPELHREHGSTFVAAVGGGMCSADLAAGSITSFLPEEIGESARRVLLEAPVWRCLAYSGMSVLHAAGIVIEGRSLLLRGGSGAGKSTLAARAFADGHALLGDESVWFDPGDGQPSLRGSPWRIELEPESLALVPDLVLAPKRGESSTDRKQRVDLAALDPSRCLEHSPLGPLVFLERQPGSAPRCDRLSIDEARDRYFSERVPGEHSLDAERVAQALDRLLELGAWRLQYAEPSGAMASLETLAAEL